MGNGVDVVPVDPAGRIAARQRGVVARQQLREAGLSARAIEYRLETGRLHPIYRGVYAVGHPHLPYLARETAALLACGARAVLSHRTAAAVWQLTERLARTVEVTVAGGAQRSRSGITVHRTVELPRGQIRIREGLAVTDPDRTLLDLATVVSRREVTAAFDAARARKLLREQHLLALIARFPTRRGTRTLRALLATPGFSRSQAERVLRRLIARANLPRPLRNARIAGHEVDFHWPDCGLVVEVDGYEFHSDREAFETDRRRDGDLLAAGYRVIRITWRQLTNEPEAVVARLARLL